MRDLYHYYHAYVNGDPDVWRPVVRDHFHTLRSSGLLDQLAAPVKIGVVGNAAARDRLWKTLDKLNIDRHIVAVNQMGWEQITLYPLWAAAESMPDGAVLYAHTKGVAHPSPRQEQWRQSMQAMLVGMWGRCVEALDKCDVIGAYRIVNDGVAQAAFGDGATDVLQQLNAECGTAIPTEPKFPEIGEAIFAGNYWWSTTAWIGNLPAPRMRSRYDAETWVGQRGNDGYDPSVGSPEYFYG